MTKRLKVPKAIKARAFVGVWGDNELGWGIPTCLSDGMRTRVVNPAWEKIAVPGDQCFWCDITITPVLVGRGKKRRPITRVKKGETK